jgi:hypothetical protein
LRELGRLDEAELTLAEAMTRFPNNEMPCIHHAWVAVKRTDWSEALERWRAKLSRFPDNAYANAGVIEALMVLGRTNEADISLRHLLSRFPDCPEFHALRARLPAEAKEPTIAPDAPGEFWRGRIRDAYREIRSRQATTLLPLKELLRAREYRDVEGSLISPDTIDTPEKDGPLYLEKRLNYVYLLHQLRPWSVLEIGFNWGYSASLIMESFPGCLLKSIDIAHHWYTRPAGDQMAQLYPGRFSFVWLDSHDALREEQASGVNTTRSSSMAAMAMKQRDRISISASRC